MLSFLALLCLAVQAPALEERAVMPSWFSRGQTGAASDEYDLNKLLPRWFFMPREALLQGGSALAQEGLPLKAVMPSWFAKARSADVLLEDQNRLIVSIGNMLFPEKAKPLVVPPPPEQKERRLAGGLPFWYRLAEPQAGAAGLYLPGWFKSRGVTKVVQLPRPEKTEGKTPWVSNFSDQPLRPLTKDLPPPSGEKTRKTDPPRNYAQFKAAMEPFLRRLDGKIELTVSPQLDDSAVKRYLEEIMFDWVIKSYSYDREGGFFSLSLVYYDWYRVYRGAQNPQVGSVLSERDHQTRNAAWNVISQVLKSGGNRDQLTLIKGFHDYLVKSARYSDRPRYRSKNAILDDNHQTPDRESHSVLVDKEGICESYASAFQLMCRLCGVECIMVCGKAGSPADWHAWNMVRIGGRWRHIDVTFDDPTPDKPGKVIRDYFMLTDSQMSKDHNWDRSRYPRTN